MTAPHGGFDPLVPDDLSGWSANLTSVISRSWRRILPILAVTGIVPAIVSTWIGAETLTVTTRLDAVLPANPQGRFSSAEATLILAEFGAVSRWVGIGLVASFVVAYLSCVGWAASLRIALADAAGRRLETRDAIAYGLRAGLRMWGWYVLAGICVLVGLCLCILPGVYLSVVFGLFAPVVVAEGGPALARSLRLVHGSFGRTLGRMLLLILLVLAVTCSASLLTGLLTPAIDLQSTTGIVLDGVGTYLSSLLVAVLLTGGLLVTYAEARAANEPGLTAQRIDEGAPA